MKLSQSEENYIKALFHLTEQIQKSDTSSSELADKLKIKAASVTAMLRRLRDKKLVSYKPYSTIKLSKRGRELAVQIIRKHRLWEVFLVKTLGFSWDKVHDIAEQLEHIESAELINRLDAFLKHPSTDPHGDPIPNAKGIVLESRKKQLAKVVVGNSYKVVSVADDSSPFLKYLLEHGISIGSQLKLENRHEFDESHSITLLDGRKISLSKQAAEHILVI